MNNSDLVRSATGLTKAEGGTLNLSDVNFDSIIPRADVLPLINLTRSHSGWLQEISSFTKSRSTGKVPIYDLNEPVMEYVGEQDPTSPTTRPDSKKAEYHTRKHKSVIVLSHEELREAAAVDGQFETTVLESFTTQLGNDVANAAFNGDRTLGAVTRQQRALRGVDGVYKQLLAGATVSNANGKAFAKGVFQAAYDAVPQRWRNDRNRLRWLYNDRVENAYRAQLTQIATPLGDSAHTTLQVMPPLGIRPLIVPQISDHEGPTAIAPTSATDGTTYIEFVLTTLVTAGDPSTAALGVGRKFLVTNTTTGYSEVCTGFLDTTLRIRTTGLLGQSTVSTTAGDYTVRPYDETHIALGDPKGISIVWLDEWRVFRKWNEQLDQLEITIYLEFDVLLPVPEMFVVYRNIAAPPLTW